MTELERGIANLTKRAKDKRLTKQNRLILEVQLKRMEAEQSMRELSPQRYYKEGVF